jgi:hypothetical protein
MPNSALHAGKIKLIFPAAENAPQDYNKRQKFSFQNKINTDDNSVFQFLCGPRAVKNPHKISDFLLVLSKID